MSPFQEKVIQVVRMVPMGKVASYGQVALYVGAPRAARQVGWILRSLEEKVEMPWWRVINNEGRITIRGNRWHDKPTQKKLLESDGIPIGDDYLLDIHQYRWRPDAQHLKQMELEGEYLKRVLEKYF